MGSEWKFKVGQKVQINRLGGRIYEEKLAGIIKQIDEDDSCNKPYSVLVLSGDCAGKRYWAQEEWLSELAEEVNINPSEFRLGQRVAVAGYGLGEITHISKHEPGIHVRLDDGHDIWARANGVKPIEAEQEDKHREFKFKVGQRVFVSRSNDESDDGAGTIIRLPNKDKFTPYVVYMETGSWEGKHRYVVEHRMEPIEVDSDKVSADEPLADDTQTYKHARLYMRDGQALDVSCKEISCHRKATGEIAFIEWVPDDNAIGLVYVDTKEVLAITVRNVERSK